MSQFVTDTHALHWHLSHRALLSPEAQHIFAAADQGQYKLPLISRDSKIQAADIVPVVW